MSFFDQFMGKETQHDDLLAINPASDISMSLQLLLNEKLSVSPEALQLALRAYDPSMAEALCVFDGESDTFLGLVGWGEHRVQLIGIDAPYPNEALEPCVYSAPISESDQTILMSTTRHILMYYRGYSEDLFEQHLVLQAVAGVLADFGVLGVINETARTALPVSMFSGTQMANYPEPALELLSTFPMYVLAIGIVKFKDEAGHIWLRSCGAEAFELPNFAVQESDLNDIPRWYEVFHNMQRYMLDESIVMRAGETFQMAEASDIRCLRQPLPTESFLDGPGEVLVIDRVKN